MFRRLYFYIIATLLHYANSSPPATRQSFYDLKKRLLARRATYDGFDIQHVVKSCWGGWDRTCGPNCRRCGGTGIYSQSWNVLTRYKWYGYKFHVPAERLYVPPKIHPVTIHGLVEHRDYGRIPNEAVLWLYFLLGEWKLFWRQLTCCRVCGWTWWPLLNIQKVAMEANMFFTRRRCFCGRWYWTWGTGHQQCRKCRARRYDLPEVSDVPF